MLEGLAAWILNTYVGEYLENLNTDQLSIGLLQGEVELENLPLKRDALRALELPVEVHSGFVGKIKLQIPVSRLRSEPWVIFIEKLFLIAGPISEYDEKTVEASALSRKLVQLEALEAKAKGVQGSKQNESYYTNWMSYGTSLMANIVENVQLKIKDVHIRYEDEESCLHHRFSCGILIHSLSAQSTDQTWLPKFVRRDNSEFMWKLLELQGLSLYWDTNSEILSRLEPKEMMAAMAKHFESPSSSAHDYILAPVNAEAHLTRNCSSKPLRSRFTPRIICDIHLQKIPLSLSDVQYRQMMECVKAFEVLNMRWRHRKWRPNVPVKENARKWWSYAIAVHLEPLKEQNKTCSWTFALERARDITSYSKVYQEYLNKSDLSFESKNLKDDLEKKLSFELLLILRELVEKKIERSNSTEVNDELSKGKGFLQWMFPSWGGWYSPAVDTTDDVKYESSSKQSEVEELKSHLEEEILDVLDSADNDSLLKRDTVFAQLNFSLSQGTFSLLQSESLVTSPTGKSSLNQLKSMIDLEFSDVSTKLETRPRNGSFLFEIKLGALYLHDKMYSDTHFPHIIAPQNRDVSFMYNKSSSITVFPLPSFLNQQPEEKDMGDYLFELSYEKKPFTINADHRLNITTRALDVVYNPQVLRGIADFFSLHHGKSPTDFSVSELKLTAAARARYETLKQQTKAELQQKWDEILDGEDKTVYSRGWNIELNISAPQIIIPEDICDKNSSVVVFDLGKLHFFNARTEEVEKITPSSDEMDDDEYFTTPCSTPQELIERAKKANELMEMMSNQKDAQLLKEHIYEKYTLELSNIQILVSRLKDNWKFAQLRGTSTMHILDRFSITVQTERRMVYTQDPDWPCIAVTGNLPKLIVHISEQKVNALQTCFDVLNSPITYKSVKASAPFSSHDNSFDLVEQLNERSSKEKKQLISKEITEGHEGSLLLLMEFCIDQMSFDVQSRGHSVAELQVTGVKTTLAKHPHDVSLSLCVHSLLLVDALQTYGPDFELLLASHKHLSMDSTSGSLRDSEPNSPASPASPDAISSPQIGKSAPTPPAALSAALSTLKSSSKTAEGARRWSSSLAVPKTEQYASDALITMEFNWIESPTSEADSMEVLQIGTVQFNNLDVIANQETIVELVDFVKRIALERNRKSVNGKLSPVEELNKFISEKEGSASKYISRTEITFDFNRLNILLLRAVSQKHSTLGQKVATASISGARIQATIGTVIEIQGSLGGLQVLDLITENTKHKKIISIGYDPLTAQPVDLLNQLEEEIYKPFNRVAPSEPDYALTFSIIRGDKTESPGTVDSPQAHPSFSEDSSRQQGYLNINLRMASLCYTHSPRLLHELSSCATEFKAYMSSLASSIKSAATEVAKGIVSKRTGSISASLHGNNPEVLTYRARFESIDDISDDHVFLTADPEDVTVDLKLDVLLQTPIVAFPTSPQDAEVLVAHLGRIAIQKGVSGLLSSQMFSINRSDLNKDTTVLIEVRDMNMHFVNVEQKAQVSSNVKTAPEAIVFPNLSTQELYACEDKNQLIIHDTIIEVVASSHKSDIASEMVPSVLDANSSVHYEQNSDPNQIEVRGKVVNPLRVVLAKHQFRQIMKVLDNLTYFEDASPVSDMRQSTFTSNLETCDELSSLKVKCDIPQTAVKLHNCVKVSFELPDLITELRDDLTDREEGIVCITFQEFLLEYRMEKMYEATLQVTLQTLLMEDLRNNDVSRHCYLMSSASQVKNTVYPVLPKSNFISTSCPSLTETSTVFSISSVSLPDRLCTQNMFSLSSGRKISGSRFTQRSHSKTEETYPTTPPPSPTPSSDLKNHSLDALVSVNITIIDKKSPHFSKKYNKTNNFIDIDFNSLDIILNLQTWVMVIDFFSFGGDEIEKVVMDRSNLNLKSSFYGERKTDNEISRESSNSEIRLKVKSLTVVLNKPEYKLASANISNYISDMSFRDSSYTVKGTLGSISVSDLSPHGYLYPEKFITTGSEALHFHVFKYCNTNPNVQTEYDMSVKCQMSSVQYVHTQRFLTEITTFFRHFSEMQELIRRIRLAASGADVNPESTRGSRIKLDISAGSPVIAIPQSASLTDVLVADLGRITVCNTFLFFQSEGTISYCKKRDVTEPPAHKKLKRTGGKESIEISEIPSSDQTECLLDVINVELTDMDLYSAVHIPQGKNQKRSIVVPSPDSKDLVFPSFIIRKQGNDLLQQKFMLQVQVERNLDSAISHVAPDWAVEGVVSSVYVTLDKKQYKLIFGVLNQNLGEPLEEFSFDPNTESEQFVLMDTDEKAWTTMGIRMDLVNVSLELIRNDGIVNKPGECSLARFDFIKSRLSFEAYSDGSRDIDLVSNMIQVLDIRYKDAPVNNRPNVFTKVLQPTNINDNNGSTLQAEVHYRISKDCTRFTVLFNNMRMMGVFEFLGSVLNFLTVPSSGTPQKEVPEPQQRDCGTDKKFTTTQPNFEMKINVTNSEFVVVEDTSVWDSNAVIVKTTAVITWKPDYLEKPLSCSLQNLEVFSCILGAEDDTALSIIDPLSVSIEILRKSNSPIIQLESPEIQHVLETSAVNLNLRLSYYDITMFLKIFDSIKRQIAFYSKPVALMPSLPSAKADSSSIECLTGLGFTASDCEKALEICKGNINDAALWLTQHATPMLDASSSVMKHDESISHNKKSINLISAELRLTSFSFCIIDDCRDADVPVVELNLMDVQFVQKFLSSPEGYGNFGFSADYYNRSLSGWEPVMEPWKCSIKWKIQPIQSKDGKKIMFNVASPDAINFNITASLIELFKTVKKNWTEEYRNTSNRNKEAVSTEMNSPGGYRQRLPFVPFALKNDTGCKLWFATQITSAKQQSLDLENDSMPAQNSKFSLKWTEVPAGNLVPVPFENRSKIRHKDSHSMKLHQIIVKAEGWHPAAPVSVDRVGTYFRHALPQKSHSASAYTEKPPARIVFVVALEGSARKLITVQSSLLVSNRLDDTIELKLENSGMQYGVKSLSMYLVPQQTLPVPLHFVYAQMWARPVDKYVAFCKYSINWNDITKPGEIRGTIRHCNSIQNASEFCKYLVLVKRRKFPLETNLPPNLISSKVHPAHRIFFVPCLEIINLLPYELHYYVKDTSMSGFVIPGKTKSLHSINISEQFYIKFFLESFKRCKEVPLSSSSRHFPSRIELRDNHDRVLMLQLKVLYLPGGGLKLFITAPFWIVNRTGLPLVFKQEGTYTEAAGQFEEHELARCMAPLLFSFSDRESSNMCNMRIGRSLHVDGVSQWCMRFSLEKGIRVRRLHIARKDSRPDLVYIIGIDVRVGKGRYGDTFIVTLSPRYYLDNSTTHRLEFCQLFATKENRQFVLSAMSKSNLPFHWPRIDLDNLLCVRQPDIEDCNWSGGFPIDNIKSFHINMRDGQGKSNFLRVEIILQGATFVIVFTDADRLPPPFRIDNHSEVSITYYQTNVEQERLKTSIRANSSVPYAFDEPTLPPYITCCAPGGSAATYNMNIFREGSQLFYENFIYIIFTGTFSEDDTGVVPHNLSKKEYVLDVPYSNKVVINKREVGKRSQLWRMTSTGMLQHEGSSPPRDPHKPNSSNNAKSLVLDIADLGPQPGEYTNLILRKPDPRRQHTQTWKFTSDGRLCCSYPNMYVQSKDGFKGLRRGNDVVLGPSMPVSFVTLNSGVPLEQAISRRKLRGGSGVLTVKIVPDGPTRVLEIADIKKKQVVTRTSASSDWVVVEENHQNKLSNTGSLCSSDDSNQQSNNGLEDIEMQIGFHLPRGLGLSLVNHLSEELVYIWLHNIMVEYNKASSYHSLGGSIKDIQVDNQLRDAEKPVMLYVTEQSISDDQRHLPALHFTVQRICTPVINAEIFKHLIVTIKNLTIHLEEKHLLKLIQFARFDQKENEGEKADENENNQTQKSVTQSMAYEKRYYFSTLKLCLQQMKLSVLTSSNMPVDLLQVKKKMRLTLIRFEDATIELDAFLRVHPFETAGFLIDSIIEHYKEELKSEAVKILGAVDFLGNPLGLMNDVSDGISKLIHEGSVGGLIKNVTHGISDSAAKLSSSLSDGLGVVAMDDKHQRMRKQIRQQGGGGNDHLMTGLKGLGFGLIGGVTSVFTQTYEGAVHEGVQGFFSGLGKGIVGTVAKPAVGFLDFASGAASAMRDTSKGSSHSVLVRTRPPRTCVGSGGLLPRYSFQQALGQEFLYNLNNRDYNELFIAKEQIRSGSEDLHALISNEQVYFLSSGSPSTSNVVLTVPFTDLFKCSYVYSDAGVIGEVRHYLQLIMKADNTAGSITVPSDSAGRRHSRSTSFEPLCKKPQVRCDSEEVAQKVAMQINYAKSLHEERTYMIIDDDESDEEKE